jgi:hypothetical protein
MVSLITLPKKYSYQVAGEEQRPRGVNFDYVLGGNGLYLRAVRTGLKVCVPLQQFEVRDLPNVASSFEMAYPRVPLSFTNVMLRRSRRWAESGKETLFHFTPETDEPECWMIHEPEQIRMGGSCRPLDDSPGSTYERALIEAHSHHRMKAYFSSVDDRDETGFRIYAVMGSIPDAPKIRVRVGVYGYYWTIPAEWVFELPEELSECMEVIR